MQTLAFVYTILIVAYILSSMFFSVGGRLPYSRGVNAVMAFLRDVCEPFLRIFRRFIPPLGPLDLSPMVAIIVLNIVGRHRRQPDPRVSAQQAWARGPGSSWRRSWSSTR